MDKVLTVILASFLGGTIQSVTGFGAAIIIMLFLPVFIEVSHASAISVVATMFLAMYIWAKYRSYVKYKKIILPIALTVVVSGISIYLLEYFDIVKLQIFFGIFLILLALYYLIFFDKMNVKPSLKVNVICAFLAGIGGGFFGISGPPAGVYFLSATDSKEEYLGALNAFFSITLLFNAFMRVGSGNITSELWIYIALGTVMCIFGVLVGGKIMGQISTEVMRKFIYVFMIIAGGITIAQNVF